MTRGLPPPHPGERYNDPDGKMLVIVQVWRDLARLPVRIVLEDNKTGERRGVPAGEFHATYEATEE